MKSQEQIEIRFKEIEERYNRRDDLDPEDAYAVEAEYNLLCWILG